MAVVPATAPCTIDGNEEYETEFGYNDYDSFEDKRKKLFIRPLSTPYNYNRQLCGTKGVRTAFDTKSVPNSLKLTLRRKTNLDLIRDQIPRPEGSVPPTALPTWFEIDMTRKIPYINTPDKYMYYARGKLATPLHRCHPFYTVYDQLNHDRVVNTPYNALHDPSVKSYLFRPTVKAFLCQQGFINDRNEVYCSLRDFNTFRGYLGTMYNDEVGYSVFRRDSNWKYQRQQMFKVHSYLSYSGGRQAFLMSRRLRAQAVQKETRQNKMHKYTSKQNQMELQMTNFREQKAKENLMRVMLGYERDKKVAERLYRIRFERLLVQREMLKQSTMKDIELSERKKNNRIMMEKADAKFKINWVDCKLEFGKKQLARDKQLEEAMRNEHLANSKKRQRRVEHDRAMMPARIEKAKQVLEKKWAIVRKFAMRWLDKVRRRLNAPKDLLHESVWIGKSKGVMDDTLKNLKEISGYEKLDDFILNIMKLKRQIQHQIELEEAEEAAAALATGDDVDAEVVVDESDKAPISEFGLDIVSDAPPESQTEE